jgi:hypothetical protein
MITSISGTQLFTLGRTTTPLAIASGNLPLNQTLVLQNYPNNAMSNARRTALAELRTIDLDSQVVAAASNITNQAQSASNALSTFQEVTATFPNTISAINSNKSPA